MSTKIKDILPNFEDQDFLFGVLSDYTLKYVVAAQQEDERLAAIVQWNIEHAEYANSILKKLGGTGVDQAIESTKKYIESKRK